MTGYRRLDSWPVLTLPMASVAAPQLGLGCGDLFAGEASVRVVRAAFDAGLRYFDVARLYGDGTAESVLGEALGPVRDQVIITTKAGIVPWSMQLGRRLTHKAAKTLSRLHLAPKPAPPGERYGAFGPGELKRSLDASLKALRTDHVDLLLLHECHLADVRADQTRELLEKWRAEGRIRGYGIATHFPDTVDILRERPDVAPVAQFASDAWTRNALHLPSRPQLTITHSALKSALPMLRQRLEQDTGLAARWTEATGLSATDSGALVRVLLGLAAADNPDGMVLFSSSKPERIAEMATGRLSPDALAGAANILEALR